MIIGAFNAFISDTNDVLNKVIIVTKIVGKKYS